MTRFVKILMFAAAAALMFSCSTAAEKPGQEPRKTEKTQETGLAGQTAEEQPGESGTAKSAADTFSLVTCNRRTLVMAEGHTVNGRTRQYMEEAILPNLAANDVTDLEEGLVNAGEGFNDSLMDTVTDKGRGAYIFLDSEEENGRVRAR